MEETHEKKDERPSSAASPAKSRKVVRPEDVIFHEVDTLGGIIITGAPHPGRLTKKPAVKPPEKPER